MDKQHTRKNKMQLLKDLQSGRASIQDLIPQTVCIWYFNLDNDGLYKTGDLALTRSEYEEYN